jgi:hypothetical protein
LGFPQKGLNEGKVPKGKTPPGGGGGVLFAYFSFLEQTGKLQVCNSVEKKGHYKNDMRSALLEHGQTGMTATPVGNLYEKNEVSWVTRSLKSNAQTSFKLHTLHMSVS